MLSLTRPSAGRSAVLPLFMSSTLVGAAAILNQQQTIKTFTAFKDYVDTDQISAVTGSSSVSWVNNRPDIFPKLIPKYPISVDREDGGFSMEWESFQFSSTTTNRPVEGMVFGLLPDAAEVKRYPATTTTRGVHMGVSGLKNFFGVKVDTNSTAGDDISLSSGEAFVQFMRTDASGVVEMMPCDETCKLSSAEFGDRDGKISLKLDLVPNPEASDVDTNGIGSDMMMLLTLNNNRQFSYPLSEAPRLKSKMYLLTSGVVDKSSSLASEFVQCRANFKSGGIEKGDRTLKVQFDYPTEPNQQFYNNKYLWRDLFHSLAGVEGGFSIDWKINDQNSVAIYGNDDGDDVASSYMYLDLSTVMEGKQHAFIINSVFDGQFTAHTSDSLGGDITSPVDPRFVLSYTPVVEDDMTAVIYPTVTVDPWRLQLFVQLNDHVEDNLAKKLSFGFNDGQIKPTLRPVTDGSKTFFQEHVLVEHTILVDEVSFWVGLELMNLDLRFECSLKYHRFDQAKCWPTEHTASLFPSAGDWVAFSIVTGGAGDPNDREFKYPRLTITPQLALPAKYYAVTDVLDLTDAPKFLDMSTILPYTGTNQETGELSVEANGSIYTITAYSRANAQAPSASPIDLGWTAKFLNSENRYGHVFSIDQEMSGTTKFVTYTDSWYSDNDHGANAPPNLAVYDVQSGRMPDNGARVTLSYDETVKSNHARTSLKPSILGYPKLHAVILYDETLIPNGSRIYLGAAEGLFTEGPTFTKDMVEFTMEASDMMIARARMVFPVTDTAYETEFIFSNGADCDIVKGRLPSTSDVDHKSSMECNITLTINPTFETNYNTYRYTIDANITGMMSQDHKILLGDTSKIVVNDTIYLDETVSKSFGGPSSTSPSGESGEEETVGSFNVSEDSEYVIDEGGDSSGLKLKMSQMSQNNLQMSVNEGPKGPNGAEVPPATPIGLNQAPVRALNPFSGHSVYRFDVGNELGIDELDPVFDLTAPGVSANVRYGHDCNVLSKTHSGVVADLATRRMSDTRCYAYSRFEAGSAATRGPSLQIELLYPDLGYHIASISATSTGAIFDINSLAGVSIQAHEDAVFFAYGSTSATTVDSLENSLDATISVFFIDGTYALFTFKYGKKSRQCTFEQQFSKYIAEDFNPTLNPSLTGPTMETSCAFSLSLNVSKGELITTPPSIDLLPGVPEESGEVALTTTTKAPRPPSPIQVAESKVKGDMMAHSVDGFTFVQSSLDETVADSGLGIDTPYTFETRNDKPFQSALTTFYGSFGRSKVSLSSTPYTCSPETDTTFLDANLSLDLDMTGTTSNPMVCFAKARYGAMAVPSAEYKLRGVIDMSAVVNSILTHEETMTGSGVTDTTKSGMTSFNIHNSKGVSYVGVSQTVVFSSGVAQISVALSATSCTATTYALPNGYSFEATYGSYKPGDKTCAVSAYFPPILPSDGSYAMRLTFIEEDSFSALYGEGVGTLTGGDMNYVIARDGTIDKYTTEGGVESILAYNNNEESAITIAKVVDTLYGKIEVLASFDTVNCTVTKSVNVWIKVDYTAQRNNTVCDVSVSLASAGKSASIQAEVSWDEVTGAVVKDVDVSAENGNLAVPKRTDLSYTVTAEVTQPGSALTVLTVPITFATYPGAKLTLVTKLSFAADRIFCDYTVIDADLPDQIDNDGEMVEPITYEIISETTMFTCKPSIYVSVIPPTVNAMVVALATAAASATAAAGVGYYLYDKYRYRTFDVQFDEGRRGEAEDSDLSNPASLSDADYVE